MENLYDLHYPWLPTNESSEMVCCMCQGKNPSEEKISFGLNDKTFKISRCLEDDLMYLDPQPGQKYCEALYSHPSYFEGTDDMYGMLINDEKSTGIARIRVDEIRKYAPASKSLFEVGAAHGHTLLAARDSGFDTAKGVEFSEQAVTVARNKGAEVVYGDINDFKAPTSESFDVICGYSVLEHLSNPYEFLKKILPALNRGGVLVMRVPVTPPEGPRLSLLDHFWHFTHASIRKIMEMNNLKVIDVFPSGVFKGIEHGGELHSMTIVAILPQSSSS